MKQTNRAFTKVVSLVAVLLLLIAATVIPASATGNVVDNIHDATKGVFLIVYTYEPSPQPDAPDQLVFDPDRELPLLSFGTGFLVNADTVITAYHVLHSEDQHQALRFLFGPNYLDHMQIRVYYKAGAFVKADEFQPVANSSYDFTALTLRQPINGAQQLTLAEGVSDETLKSPMNVYAMGYPYTSTQFQEASESTFTAKDVDTKNGIVNKFEMYEGFNHIKHTAVTLEGMSGGPLLNDAGQVIGVNRLKSNITESENWAVPSYNLIDSLKQMNVAYTSAPIQGGATPSNPVEPATDEATTAEGDTEPVAIPTDFTALNAKIAEAGALDGSKYKSGFDELQGMLATAKAVAENPNATQQQVDDALADLNAAMGRLVEKGGLDTKMIIIIAVAAVVLIALVVILLLVLKKKKSDADFDAPGGFAPPQNGGFTPPQGGFTPPQNGGFAPAAPAAAPRFTPAPTPTAPGGAETSVLSKGGNETTVLSSGSNETTVLSGKPYAKLTRKSNNEIIQVAAATFVIGKERRKVNYCIEDNTTISRSHAQIMNSGAKISVMDLGSKNGTFVNGVKCNPSEAVAVKDGDKITLSDEEFIINFI